MVKTITLQITKKNFDLIKAGKQTVETREVREATKSRYFKLDKDGNPTAFRPYDQMLLINGRKTDAPRLLIEILSIDCIEVTDPETGEPETYEELGQTYFIYHMEYELGKILDTFE